MAKAKVAVTFDVDLLGRNRSQAIETALAEKLERLARTRLARECAKLDPQEEKALVQEGLAAVLETWPEY